MCRFQVRCSSCVTEMRVLCVTTRFCRLRMVCESTFSHPTWREKRRWRLSDCMEKNVRLVYLLPHRLYYDPLNLWKVHWSLPKYIKYLSSTIKCSFVCLLRTPISFARRLQPANLLPCHIIFSHNISSLSIPVPSFSFASSSFILTLTPHRLHMPEPSQDITHPSQYHNVHDQVHLSIYHYN